MDWANSTVVLAGRDLEPTAMVWLELLVDHGYDALEYVFLYVLPLLSNVVFIMYTIYYFARVTPQRSEGSVNPQKMILSIRIAALELVFLAAQAIATGLDMQGLAPVNHLMGFVAAVTGYIIFDRETGKGYPVSKSAYFFVLLWILIDINKLSGYLFDHNKHILSFGGYITGFYRSDLLTDMMMPSVKPGPDLVTLLSQLDAKYERTMPQSTPECRSEAASEDTPQDASEKTSERTSEEAIEDILKAWNNTGGCSARAPNKAQKRKKKHTRNMRHKAR